MRQYTLYLILLLSLWLAPHSRSEQPYIHHLDHSNGLNSNYVRGIGQDGHGFVWVVTGNGLNRFDGTAFSRFTKENSGLSSNELNCVVKDPINPDKLWIGTRYNGICIYDYSTDKISEFKGEILTSDVTGLSISSDNKIWITHYHMPPEKLDPATGNVERIFRSIPKNFPLPVWCSMESDDGKLYIGHENTGFSSLDLKSMNFENFMHDANNPESISGNTVYSICIDNDGMVWLGTENGLSRFNPTNKKFTSIFHNDSPDSLLPGQVKAISLMKNGDLWIATSKGGVSILSRDDQKRGIYTFKNLTPSSGFDPDGNLYSTASTSIFEDSFGNKWIGYYSDGIDVVCNTPPFFRMISIFRPKGSKLSHPAVWSLANDSENGIWIGGDREFAKIGNFSPIIYKLPSSSTGQNTPIRAINAIDNGMILLGTSNDGAYLFDSQNGLFTKINGIDPEVRCFFKDKDRGLLVGTHNGVYVINNNMSAYPIYEINEVLPDKYITSILNDNSGNILIATFGKGIVVFNKENRPICHLLKKDGLPTNSVNSLFMDSKGNIWVATREGVAKIENGNFNRIIKCDMPANSTSTNIKALIEDHDRKIWMTAEEGIFSCDINDSIFICNHAGNSDMKAFIESSASFFKGWVLFGSLNGLALFNPERLDGNMGNNDKLIINNIIAHDKDNGNNDLEISIPIVSDKIRLPHNLNTFRIKLNIPDISVALNSEIRYRMEGVNETWMNLNPEYEAIYRNMKPGKYVFIISRKINGGEWSEPTQLLTITITPPLYLTWWAKMLYLLSLIIIVCLFTYFYKYKLNLEKNLDVEKESRINSQLLNEERMAFYTNITHELRTPLSLIIGPIEDLINDPDIRDEHRKKLHTIRTSSMRLLNLINGILEFRKTETRNRKLEVCRGNLVNFVREIGLRFKELNSNKDVNIVIAINMPEEQDMYYDPEMINIILNNLLGNAMKYTKKGVITLSVSEHERNCLRYIDITVSDTGEGISPEILPHIFKRYYQANHNKKVAGTGIGLALTQNLVELHEGLISVSSEQGKGSSFTVSLLIDNNYPNAIHKDISGDNETADVTVRPDINIQSERLTILIVEDDEDVKDYIASSFADTYNVICASNGKEGLDSVKANFPDIVISDIMMPVMDGIELCHAIKSDVATSHIPVILLTAKDSLLDKEEGYNSGADSYITKPFSIKLLQSRINNILKARHNLALRLLSEPHSGQNTISDAGVTISKEDVSDKEIVKENNLSILDRNFISKLRMVVEDNIEMEDMDMPFLTDKMCMSHSTLYRKVKGITGLTPNEFIRKIKLTRAVQLLKSENVAINEIPFLTGFNSISYFRRVFKKEFGITPSEFIQNRTDQQN